MMFLLSPLIVLLPLLTLAQICPRSADTGEQQNPANMGVAPTGIPLCETVNTGACSEIFGSETACVEKPKDQSWTAQQYIDVMDALQNDFVMEQLIVVSWFLFLLSFFFSLFTFTFSFFIFFHLYKLYKPTTSKP